MTNLLTLADRVEGAEGADRRLDGLIWQAIEPDHEYVSFGEASEVLYRRDPGDHSAFDAPPPYTSSIDAAMTLLDKYGVLLHLSDIGADGLPYARVGRPDLDDVPILEGISSGIAMEATPVSGLALALCAAALRARAQSQGDPLP